MALALATGIHFSSVQNSSINPLPRWSGANSISMPVIGQGAGQQALSYQATPKSAASSAQNETTPLQDAFEAVGEYFGATQTVLSMLGKNLDRGDMVTAQNYLNNFWSSFAFDNSQGEDANVASDPFLSQLWTLGQALQKGDLDASKSAYADAVANSPKAMSQQLSMDRQTADFDGSLSVYHYEHGGGMATGQLTADIATIDADLRSESNLMSDGLVGEGYSSTMAADSASQITGIHNGTAADNAAVDSARATKWIDSLIALANEKTSKAGNTTIKMSTIDDLLGSDLMNSVDAWDRLNELIGHVLDPTGQYGNDGSSAYSLGVQLVA